MVFGAPQEAGQSPRATGPAGAAQASAATVAPATIAPATASEALDDQAEPAGGVAAADALPRLAMASTRDPRADLAALAESGRETRPSDETDRSAETATLSSVVDEQAAEAAPFDKAAVDRAKSSPSFADSLRPESVPAEDTEAETAVPPAPVRLSAASGRAVYPDPLAGPLASPLAGQAPEHAPGPAATSATEEALGLTRRDRIEAQRRLQLTGNDPRLVDGVFGPATREAIMGWQKAAGMSPTGFLDEPAMALLAEQTEQDYRAWQAAVHRRQEESENAVVASSVPRARPVPSTTTELCHRTAAGEIAYGQSMGCDARGMRESFEQDIRGLGKTLGDIFR